MIGSLQLNMRPSSVLPAPPQDDLPSHVVVMQGADLMLSDFEKNNRCIEIPPQWDLPKYLPQARVRIADFSGDEHWATVIGLEWNCDDNRSPARKGVEKGMHYIIRFDPGNSLYTDEDTLTVSEDEII